MQIKQYMGSAKFTKFLKVLIFKEKIECSMSRYASKILCLLLLGVGFFAVGTLHNSFAQGSSGVTHTDLKPLIYWDTAASERAGEEDRLFKKKKMPKKMFYGIKTKKAYSKKVFGTGNEVELFYVMKKYEEPTPYVQDIHWYDKRTRKVRVGEIKERDKPFALLLHGPYEVLRNGEVKEYGQFFKGTKHGRWMQYNGREDMELISKENYYKGFYKESLISWLDRKRTKVKEVVPIKDGRRHGDYLLFYDDGSLAMKGEYEFGFKVGTWYEYYDGPGTREYRKRRTRYPNSFYDRKEQKPYIDIEYNEDGDVVYDYDKAKRDEDVEIKRPEDYDPEFYSHVEEKD